jgi:murein DD-endopeptidase MepM/ murein hydrolase activator NlpD
LGNHIGVEEFAWDFGLPMRTPVLAARGGVVTLAATYSPAGSECHDGCPGALDSASHAFCCSKCLFSANRVNIQHDDGVVSTYSHFDELVVQKGQKVSAGDLLGYSGTSGCSTGPHLHFQVMQACPTGYCQSLPIKFEDAGDPVCGQKAISQNTCR